MESRSEQMIAFEAAKARQLNPNEYSLNALKALAKSDPVLHLAILAANGWRPTSLTHALSDAQHVSTEWSEVVYHVIGPFLTHEKPFVREGAMCGLENHLGYKPALDHLKDRLTQESLPMLVEMLQEIIEDFEEE